MWRCKRADWLVFRRRGKKIGSNFPARRRKEYFVVSSPFVICNILIRACVLQEKQNFTRRSTNCNDRLIRIWITFLTRVYEFIGRQNDIRVIIVLHDKTLMTLQYLLNRPKRSESHGLIRSTVALTSRVEKIWQHVPHHLH